MFSSGDNILKEYRIVEPLETLSGEADLYRVEKDKKIFILKLYRYGHIPKKKSIKKSKNFTNPLLNISFVLLNSDILTPLIDIMKFKSIFQKV